MTNNQKGHMLARALKHAFAVSGCFVAVVMLATALAGLVYAAWYAISRYPLESVAVGAVLIFSVVLISSYSAQNKESK